jgi:hypothetical protein
MIWKKIIPASLLLGMLLAAAPAPVKTKKPSGKTDPPGAPLEAVLKAKKAKYTLDLGGKSADEIRKQIAAGNYPEAPAVDLVLEIKNTGREEVKIKIGGTYNIVGLDLKGSGAVSETLKRRITPKFVIAPRIVALEAGKSVSVPITSLSYGLKGGERAWWLGPGKYQLAAGYRTSVSPRPKDAKEEPGDFGAVTVISAPIELEVQAPK